MWFLIGFDSLHISIARSSSISVNVRDRLGWREVTLLVNAKWISVYLADLCRKQFGLHALAAEQCISDTNGQNVVHLNNDIASHFPSFFINCHQIKSILELWFLFFWLYGFMHFFLFIVEKAIKTFAFSIIYIINNNNFILISHK